MELILELTDEAVDNSGASTRFTFGEEGGTIGRVTSPVGSRSHWVLPATMVSVMHAAVTSAGGRFFIEDRHSTNGVSVNANRLSPGRAYQLHDGDAIEIGPYRIRASVTQTERVHPVPVVPEEERPRTSGEILEDFSSIGLPSSPRAVDLPNLDTAGGQHQVPLPPVPPRAEPDPPVAPRAPRGYDPSLSVFVPAARKRSAQETPWPVPQHAPPPPERPFRDPKPLHVDVPVPTRPVAPAATSPADASVREVFVAAGVDGVSMTPQLARDLGEILRIVAQGLVDALKFRRQVKREFAVERSYLGLEKNNPLKHAESGDQALRVLFADRHPAFLGPKDAIRDSFDALRNHHLATSAAVHAAFDAMLAEFDPDRLEERFNRRSSGAIVPLPNRIRYWQLYRQRFADLVNGDREDVFRRLFGDVFRKSYAAQIATLDADGGDVER
jgi:type VI secretion system FHA domain protein